MKAPMTIKQYVSQMRKIPGGRFTMGRNYALKYEGTFSSEVPAIPVDVSPFCMGATTVTVGMWREYLRANTSIRMPAVPEWGWIDSHPMVNVSWKDIVGDDGTGGYCAWASRVTGMNLLLPSQAQWEFVAKSGKDLRYPWGTSYDDSKAWSSVKKHRSGTVAVDRLNNVFANKFGVSDLCSNVWEWCYDGFEFYVKSFDRLGYPDVPRDPIGVGNSKCFKGGSWMMNDPDFFRCAYRNFFEPLDKKLYFGIGFRLAVNQK